MIAKRTGTISSEHLTDWPCGERSAKQSRQTWLSLQSLVAGQSSHIQCSTNVSLLKNPSLVPTQQTQGSFSGLVINTDKHRTYERMQMEQRQKHDRKSKRDTNILYRSQNCVIYSTQNPMLILALCCAPILQFEY